MTDRYDRDPHENLPHEAGELAEDATGLNLPAVVAHELGGMGLGATGLTSPEGANVGARERMALPDIEELRREWADEGRELVAVSNFRDYYDMRHERRVTPEERDVILFAIDNAAQSLYEAGMIGFRTAQAIELDAGELRSNFADRCFLDIEQGRDSGNRLLILSRDTRTGSVRLDYLDADHVKPGTYNGYAWDFGQSLEQDNEPVSGEILRRPDFSQMTLEERDAYWMQIALYGDGQDPLGDAYGDDGVPDPDFLDYGIRGRGKAIMYLTTFGSIRRYGIGTHLSLELRDDSHIQRVLGAIEAE